jgi:hypothetical protein
MSISCRRRRASSKKCRETRAELHSPAGRMKEIHKTLGGNLVSTAFSLTALPTLTGPVFSLNHSLRIRNHSLLNNG